MSRTWLGITLLASSRLPVLIKVTPPQSLGAAAVTGCSWGSFVVMLRSLFYISGGGATIRASG